MSSASAPAPIALSEPNAVDFGDAAMCQAAVQPQRAGGHACACAQPAQAWTQPLPQPRPRSRSVERASSFDDSPGALTLFSSGAVGAHDCGDASAPTPRPCCAKGRVLTELRLRVALPCGEQEAAESSFDSNAAAGSALPGRAPTDAQEESDAHASDDVVISSTLPIRKGRRRHSSLPASPTWHSRELDPQVVAATALAHAAEALAAERPSAGALRRLRETRRRDATMERQAKEWRTSLLPRFAELRGSRRVREFVRLGVPPLVRAELWSLSVGDALRIGEGGAAGAEAAAAGGASAGVRERSVSICTGDDGAASGLRAEGVPSGEAAPAGARLPEAPTAFTADGSDQLPAADGSHQLDAREAEDAEGRAAAPAVANCQQQARARRSLPEAEEAEAHALAQASGEAHPAAGEPQRTDAALRSMVEVDMARTLPDWRALFAEGTELHGACARALSAYARLSLKPAAVARRRGLGYVQGMSVLAAVLLLHVHTEQAALTLLANLLDRPVLSALYSLSEGALARVFALHDALLSAQMPRLHARLEKAGVRPEQYLLDWLLTLFAKVGQAARMACSQRTASVRLQPRRAEHAGGCHTPEAHAPALHSASPAPARPAPPAGRRRCPWTWQCGCGT